MGHWCDYVNIDDFPSYFRLIRYFSNYRYTLLAGKTPFSFSKNQNEMYRKIRKNEYTIPEGLSLSSQAESLVKDLLCADPGK